VFIQQQSKAFSAKTECIVVDPRRKEVNKKKKDEQRVEEEEKSSQLHGEEIMRRTAMRMMNQEKLVALTAMRDNFSFFKAHPELFTESVADKV